MKWRVSGPKMTVRVETDEKRIITWAAPVVRKFQGQPLANLERWLDTRAESLEDPNGRVEGRDAQ